MILLDLRIQPNAKKEKFELTDHQELKLKVRAIPEEGRANERVLEILSQALRLPKTQIRLIRGQKNRLKTFEIETELSLREALDQLLQARWK